jgi:hypothetical protein
MRGNKRIERENQADEISPQEYRRCDLCDFLTCRTTRIFTTNGIPLTVDRFCLEHINGVRCEANGADPSTCIFCQDNPDLIKWEKEGSLYKAPKEIHKIMANLHASLEKVHKRMKSMWEPKEDITWKDAVSPMLWFLGSPEYPSVRDDPIVVSCVARLHFTTSYEQVVAIMNELKTYDKTKDMFFHKDE